jgi:signal transduction histidine kinase
MTKVMPRSCLATGSFVMTGRRVCYAGTVFPSPASTSTEPAVAATTHAGSIVSGAVIDHAASTAIDLTGRAASTLTEPLVDAAPPASSDSVPRFIGPGFAAAFAAVTVAGFAQAATSSDAFVARYLSVLGAACILYVLLGTGALAIAERRGSRRLVQFLIGALGALAGVTTLASHGYTSMMLLAVVSVSVLHLGTRYGVAISALATAVAVTAFALRSTLWTASLQTEIAFVSGIAFVFVFSQIALREQRARGRIQRLVAELADANARLTAQAAHVEQLATAQERNRIAREIHDGLGHYLTVVHVQLEAAKTYLPTRAQSTGNPGGDLDRLRAALDTAQKLTHEGLSDVRRSVALLRGAPRPPLIDALAELTCATTAAGIATTMRIEGAPRRLAEPVELTLYRATQEALTNACRHAHASRVGITLMFTEPTFVRLHIEDDGRGATHPAVGLGSFGLLGIRERVHLVGGSLGITTGADQGFTVELEVPG